MGNLKSANIAMKSVVSPESTIQNQALQDNRTVRDPRAHRNNLSSAASSAASFIFGSFLSKQIKQKDRDHGREKEKLRRSLSPETNVNSQMGSLSEDARKKKNNEIGDYDNCLESYGHAAGVSAR